MSNHVKLLFVSGLLVSLILILIPGGAEAAEVSTGGDITIEEGEIIDEDVYFFGDTVTVGGVIKGDAVIFAREVTLSGTVEGSFFVFAETVKISGEVKGTVRGAANTVQLLGTSGRDLMMAANTISVEGDIGDDFFGAANSGSLTGSVGRDVKASINRLGINGTVGGDVTAYVGELVFGPEAVIEGDVAYTSEKTAAVDDRAVIRGAMERKEPPALRHIDSPVRTAWSVVRPVLSLLVVSLLVALLFPVLTAGTAQTIKEKPGLSAAYGALVIFVVPFAALFLLFTLIGMPLGILSMLLYAVLIYLSRIFAGYFLAQVAFARFGWRLHPAWTALIGVFVLVLLTRLPFVGWLIHLTAVLFAVGAFLLYLFDRKGKRKAVEAHAE